MLCSHWLDSAPCSYMSVLFYLELEQIPLEAQKAQKAEEKEKYLQKVKSVG